MVLENWAKGVDGVVVFGIDGEELRVVAAGVIDCIDKTSLFWF